MNHKTDMKATFEHWVTTVWRPGDGAELLRREYPRMALAAWEAAVVYIESKIQSSYEEAESEHLGDPDAKTGIYASRPDAQADERGALMCERLRAMGLNTANEAADLIEQMCRAAAPQASPLNGIPATLRHDEGAIARCSYCGRYSIDSKTLSDRQPACECGERHGWSGSFEKPGRDAKWSGSVPTTAPQAEAAHGVPEPIYQTRWGSPETVWGDVEKAAYDDFESFGYAARRIVYAAAPAPVSETTGEMTVTEALMRDLLTHGIAIHRIAPADVFAEPAPVSEPAPYSAPFTTDVPHCCGEPSTCKDPCGDSDFESDKPIPIVTYDDGARVILDSWTGGAHESGVFGEVALRFIDAHGVETVREYCAKDAEQPSERVEQDCPHGVDDGACKQCYGEAAGVKAAHEIVSGQQRTHEFVQFADRKRYVASVDPSAGIKPYPQPQAAEPKEERTEFENCIREHSDPDRFDDRIALQDGHYVEYATALAWEAWQARAALPQPQAAAPKGLTAQDMRLLAMRYAANYTEFDDGSLHTIDFGEYGFANFARALLEAKGE